MKCLNKFSKILSRNYSKDGVFEVFPGSGAWQTKFETVSQEIPTNPIALRPKHSPSLEGSFGGTNAEAKSPSQSVPPPVTFFIEVRTVALESPIKKILKCIVYKFFTNFDYLPISPRKSCTESISAIVSNDISSRPCFSHIPFASDAVARSLGTIMFFPSTKFKIADKIEVQFNVKGL
jgi:hypothetical protein